MAIGPFIRHLMGARLFRILGTRYRSVFVNLDDVAEVIAP